MLHYLKDRNYAMSGRLVLPKTFINSKYNFFFQMLKIKSSVFFLNIINTSDLITVKKVLFMIIDDDKILVSLKKYSKI